MRLDQACTHIVDCEHKSAPISPGGGYYAVGTPAMAGNRINLNDSREISRETFKLWTRRLLPQEGDLLLAREAPVGPVVILPSTGNIAPGQRTVLLRPDTTRALPRFLYYALIAPTLQRLIADLSLGSTVAHLNVSDVRALEVWLPPLPEQQAIAEVLGALDDKIAANTALANTADALVRAWYEKFAHSHGKHPLRTLCSNVREPIDPADAQGVYVGLEHLPRRHMWLHEQGDASEVTSGKSSFQSGDVLFGKLRPYFHKVASAPSSGVCSTDILVLRATAPALQGLVLAAASSDKTVAAASAKSAGTKMPRTSWNDIGDSEVPWPGEREALEFSGRVMATRSMVEAALRESQSLAELRDALLPALMDGTLQVKDAVRHAEAAL
ncbi:restriction endonuclease subunit S [Aestuariimicrobium sp. Y1814]|uniref:restriction endonuclease subunit S n=1 Tax=Aestuariimicrobium sp. Y1814 TaxID=3418742 RepID=UPI003DA799FC